MNTLEQALRGAFESDLGTPADRLIGDVRRGAERRRARRTTAVATGAVASVIAGVAISAAALGGSGDTPDPAPSPTDPALTPTETSTDTAPAPWREAWAVEAAGGQVFVTGRAADCDCAVLWVGQPGDWTRLHDFPARFVERLAFSPDGKQGIAADDHAAVWTTHDGGRTWAKASEPLDGRREIGGSILVAADAQHLWAANPGDGSLWLSPAEGEGFEQVTTLPGIAWDVEVAGGTVVVTAAPDDEGSTRARPLVSTDGGATWDELPPPCLSEGELTVADGALFFTCAVGNVVVVHRSTSFADWHELGRVSQPVTGVVPIGFDRVLVRGRDGVLLTEKGSSPTDVDLPSRSVPWDSARGDGAVYLTSPNGLFVSTDNGLSWAPAD